jgi:hypothetical protein
MPPLQLNKLLGALRFQSFGLILPLDHDKMARNVRDDYVAMLSPEDRVAVPKLIPAWFKPAMPIAPHQDICDSIGQGFKDLHDTLLDAVSYAHNMWRLQAKFAPMPIAGPSVAGPPGSLTGPPLESLIKQYPRCAAMQPPLTAYRDAVAKGVSQAFTMWQTTVTIPGLPLFPAYVMQPPGSAIPSPNVPQKLIACVSANLTALVAPDTMKSFMCAALDPDTKKDNTKYEPFFDAIATVLSLAFVSWLSNQMVLGIIGSGAVASPVGGPVAGVTLPTAGHLAS